jgi:prepilin-type N-terminal cleavage/methylation domain-containing protein
MRTARAGGTLLELLFALAIIALLVSLLVPAALLALRAAQNLVSR